MKTIQLGATKPEEGCTACHSPQTSTLDAYNVRRCEQCPPRLDLLRAASMSLTDAAACLACLRTFAAKEVAAA